MQLKLDTYTHLSLRPLLAMDTLSYSTYDHSMRFQKLSKK